MMRLRKRKLWFFVESHRDYVFTGTVKKYCQSSLNLSYLYVIIGYVVATNMFYLLFVGYSFSRAGICIDNIAY